MRSNSTSLIIIFLASATFSGGEIYFLLGQKNFLLPRLKDCRGREFFCKASGIFCKAFRKFCSACRFSLFGMGLLSVAMRDVNSRGLIPLTRSGSSPTLGEEHRAVCPNAESYYSHS